MNRKVFVNLPVADVDRSVRFYEAVGAVADARFAQPGVAAMLTFSEEIHFMVMTPDRFADFTGKRIVDAREEVETLICLSCDSPEAVDATADRAIAAGGAADPTPRQAMGDYMHGRSFEDPDGHIVELMWMDVDKAMAAWARQPESVA